MDSNNIGDAGATALALTLDTNTALLHIDLHGNGITDDGMKALTFVSYVMI